MPVEVAPHAGAWIETRADGAERSSVWSRPMRARGLKLTNSFAGCRRRTAVAPHAGAWIETRECHSSVNSGNVAPHAGAWIET